MNIKLDCFIGKGYGLPNFADVAFAQNSPIQRRARYMGSGPLFFRLLRVSAASHSVFVLISMIFQVYSVVDEMFLAGEIRETSQTKVLKQLLMLTSLE